MNTGTKIRTILAIATSLNTALMATDLTGFSNAKVDMAYKVVSIVLNFIIVACVTYYNNDFTEAGCRGTGYTRLLKEEAGNGEDFFDTEDDFDDDEWEDEEDPEEEAE